ncbi:MAG: hypothetical protein RG741_06215 [Bacteroidales bacterium]|nr:hypothetical protein [Bacteroidales bacterium]
MKHHSIPGNLLRAWLFIMPLLVLTACPDEKCEDGVRGMLLDYSGLDGCQWIIELESGERLEPVNLHEFSLELKDGLPVSLSYTVAEDMISICMVGKMIRISCITTDGNAPQERPPAVIDNGAGRNAGNNDQPPGGVLAYPGIISYELPDGYLLDILLDGDEHGHRVTSPDGFLLLMNDEGYYEYARVDDQGTTVSTGIIARNADDRTREEKSLLKTIIN